MLLRTTLINWHDALRFYICVDRIVENPSVATRIIVLYKLLFTKVISVVDLPMQILNFENGPFSQ